MNDSLGVYISVPFCRAKCTYCNFASGAFAADRMDQYIDRVCAEVRNAHAEAARLGADLPVRVDSIFLGGGTPSLLPPPMISRVFKSLRGEFNIDPHAEITLECAPGQLEDDTLTEFLNQGMNRISFGVQSFIDVESRAVGRLHTRATCLNEINRIRAAGIQNINIDLIAGLPHQNLATWRESIEIAIETGVPHVSVYMLEIDDDSRLGREALSSGARYGAATLPTEDETADFCSAACTWLKDAGIKQYEISNFAREGRASQHNLKYWQREPYLGFGLDAHSMLKTSSGAVRRANDSDLEKYLESKSGATGSKNPLAVLPSTGASQIEWIGQEQAFEEALFLGLRMNEGLELHLLRAEFGEALLRGAMESLTEIEEAGLVVQRNGRLMLTAAGRMASNEVFSRLLVVPA